ncbi:MAG TPA: protein-L-isoaspartate(D-aspartate) O-methyltransferase [Thermoguttaceae bacterium]|nr:protein-L-isoaspartate(D-aspartate) O-methyltransferase [Thermoguttaceae bacterium]
MPLLAASGILSVGILVVAPRCQPPNMPITATVTPEDLQGQQGTEDPHFVQARRRMVQRHLRDRGVTDPRVLEVMGRIRRQAFVPLQFRAQAHLFNRFLGGDRARELMDRVRHERYEPPELMEIAYADHPLPIGHDQTISQPYIVALMTQLVRPKPDHRALDVGTGSGYQAAVLAELCKEVYSIEIVKPLADQAAERLAALGYKNVTVRAGDGFDGWAEHAPFDVIVVAAAPNRVPQPLIDQLAPGGRLVIPVGRYYQTLQLIEKREDGTIRRSNKGGVAFVPMTGKAE